MLVINKGQFRFTKFKDAVNTLEKEFGFEGAAWDTIVASNDMFALLRFLINDGINAEIHFALDMPV